jgi:hypothetical protein
MIWPFTTIARLNLEINAADDEIDFLEARLALQGEQIFRMFADLEDAKAVNGSVFTLQRQISVLKKELAEAKRQSDAFEAVSREACVELEAKPKRKKVA